MADGLPQFDPGAGGGGAVDVLGTAGRLWRNVYKKAALVAADAARSLVAAHEYHLHGRRALVIVLDGGGTTLPLGTRLDMEVPWAYQIEGWALYSPLEGRVVIDLQRCPAFDDYPAALGSLCGGGRPYLDVEQKRRSEDVSAWDATVLARGNIVRVLIDEVEAITLVTLTLFVRPV